MVIVWEDWLSPSLSGIGANFISSSGELQFSSGGDADLLFTMESPSTPFPRVKASENGAYVVWLSASDVHSVQKTRLRNLLIFLYLQLPHGSLGPMGSPWVGGV